MKKKIWIPIAIIIALILLFPRVYHLKDGGSVVYEAILYRVEDVHSMKVGDDPNPYWEGMRVEILGFLVYDNVR